MPRISRDFDNKTLLNDLKHSMEDDKIYWIRNDAKIRASQNTQNYEEFRNIVEAAHLQGLSRSDINKKKASCWNPYSRQNQEE